MTNWSTNRRNSCVRANPARCCVSDKWENTSGGFVPIDAVRRSRNSNRVSATGINEQLCFLPNRTSYICTNPQGRSAEGHVCTFASTTPAAGQMTHDRVFGLPKDVVVALGHKHGLRSVCLCNQDCAFGFHQLDQRSSPGRGIECSGDVAVARIVSFDVEALLVQPISCLLPLASKMIFYSTLKVIGKP
jgi:hypothetical protein